MNYIELGTTLAEKAGEIILQGFGTVPTEWKDDYTPLTVVDTKVNELVLQTLSRKLPNFSLIGEEGSSEQQSEWAAVFDPIDGTTGFTHGVPTFVFALAFCKEGDPFACVVYDPVLDRMFIAEKGKGAFLNGKRIRVNQKPLGPNTTAGISWISGQTDLSAVYKHLTKQGVLMFQLLSSLYTGCLVASGSLIASIYPVKHPWDGACVKLLVEEAGGKVTSLAGESQRYDKSINGVVASNGIVHEELLHIIRR